MRARLEAEVASQERLLHSRLRGSIRRLRTIAPGDSRRIVRALEVIEITGSPFTAHLPDYTYVRPTVQIET